MPDSHSTTEGNPHSAVPVVPIPGVPSSQTARELAELELRYRQHLIDQFSRLTFKGASPAANAVSLPLSSLYVDLKAIADVPEAADTFSTEERQAIGKLREAGDSDPWIACAVTAGPSSGATTSRAMTGGRPATTGRWPRRS